MIENERWYYVVASLEQIQHQGAIFNSVVDAVKLDSESPLVQPIWSLEELTLNTLSVLIEDSQENLLWFAYECDYGRKPMKAGVEGDMRDIDSYDRLRWLIELEAPGVQYP